MFRSMMVSEENLTSETMEDRNVFDLQIAQLNAEVAGDCVDVAEREGEFALN